MSFIISGPTTVTGPTTDFTNGATNAITHFVATTAGDTIYCSNTGTGLLSRLPIGAAGDSLFVSGGGLPVWMAPVAGGTVTIVSVVAANGFNGTVATDTTTPAITLTTTVTGVLKGDATAISSAVVGTDYSVGTSALATGVLYSTTGTGVLSIATNAQLPTMTSTVGGAVPTPPNNTTDFLRGDGTFAVPPGSGGTVTTVSVVMANGFNGTIVNPTTTPAITLSTTVTGLITGAVGALVGNLAASPFAVICAGATTATVSSTASAGLVGNLLVSGGAAAVPAYLAGAATGALLLSTGVTSNPSWLASAAQGTHLINTVANTPAWALMTVSASNGFAGSLDVTGTAITLSTSVTGVLKGDGTAISAAVVGTDYSVGTSTLATGVLFSTTGTGALTIATNAQLPVMSSTVGGAVPTPPNNTTTFLRGDGTFAVPPNSGGTVTTVSVVPANGFNGSVLNPTTTPAITIETTETGLLTGAPNAIVGNLAASPFAIISAGATTSTVSSTASAGLVGNLLVSGGAAAVPAYLAGAATGALLLSTGVTSNPTWLASAAQGTHLINTVANTPAWAVMTVASSNGLAGTVSAAGTVVTLSTSITGVLKGDGIAISAAVVGTDYSVGTSTLATGVLFSTTGTGALTIATNAQLPVMSATVGGAVPTPPNNTTTFLRGDGTFAVPPNSGGTVTIVSVVMANGFNGTVATNTTTPAITLTTTVTGVLKGDGTAISVAVVGTDYSVGTSALASGVLFSTTGTGALSIATNAQLPVMSSTVGGAVPTPPNNTTTFLRGDGTFAVPPNSGGTVTIVSVVSANGFNGTVATNTTTPAITLTTTQTGLITGAGNALVGNLAASPFAVICAGATTSTVSSTATAGLVGNLLVSGGAAAVPVYLAGAATGALLLSTGVTSDPTWLASAAQGTHLINTVANAPAWAVMTVASSNGLAGTVSAAGTVVTLSTSITGVLKGDGTAISAAVVGTDYSVGTSALATGVLFSTTGTGALSIATNAQLPVMTSTVGGAVPTPPNNTTTFLRGDGTFAVPPNSGGTVTIVSVVSANGFNGTVATNTTTPAITLTTTVTGVLKGDGTAISAAVVGTDYSVGTSALASGVLFSTTGTGALTIATNAQLPVMSSTVGGAVPTPPNNTTTFLRGDGTFAVPPNSGGTVTIVSVVSANGFNGTVATNTTTPAITLTTTQTGLITGAGNALVGNLAASAFAVICAGATTATVSSTASAGLVGNLLVSGGAAAVPVYLAGAATGALLLATGVTSNPVWLASAAQGTHLINTVANTPAWALMTVASANGLAGTVSAAGTVVTLSTSITGVLKGDGTAISAAVVGTDYSVGTSALASGVLFSTTGTGALSIATNAQLPVMSSTVGGAVPTPPNNTTTFLRGDGTFAVPPGSGGTVTIVSVVSANGFNGTVATNTTTPAITLTTTQTGLITGAGNALVGNLAASAFAVICAGATTSTVSSTASAGLVGNLLVSGGAAAVPVYLAGAATGALLLTTGVTSNPTWLASAAQGTHLINTVANTPAWAAMTVASANGLAGTVSAAGTVVTLSTSITGVLKGDGTAISAAVVGTDYSVGTSALATGVLYSTTGTGALTIATNAQLPAMTATVGGAVPTPPNNTTTFLRGDGTFAVPPGSGGTVTIVSVVSANGFNGTVATNTTTPAITLTTTVTGVLKGNGTAISAATVGTDYSVGTSALASGVLFSTTGTGALTIATNAQLPAMSATVGGAVPTPPNNTTTFLRGDGTFAVPPGSGGTVTSVSVVSANGFNGSVATATTTPAITLTTTQTGLITGAGNALVGNLAASAFAVICAGATTSTVSSTASAGLVGNLLVSGGAAAVPVYLAGAATGALLVSAGTTTNPTWLASAAQGTHLINTVANTPAWAAMTVASSNGLAGTVSAAGTVVTLSTSITGVLKGDGTAISAATVGTDYSVGTSALATGVLYSTTGTGALTIATNAQLPVMSATVGGAVPTPPNNTTTFLRGDGTFAAPVGGSGTVTSVSVVSANGFNGTVATATTTPAITLTTTVTGVLKGNGTAISTATVGTDYSVGTSALASGVLFSTTGTGALSIATNAQLPTMTSTVGGAVPTPPNNTTTFLRGDGTFTTVGTVTTNADLTGPITSVGNATSIASQTGTGTTFVVNTSPVLITPNIGVATATSVNKVTITAPATSSTLTIADTKSIVAGGSFGTAWARYSFAVNGGAISTITPTAAFNTVIPSLAIIVGGTIQVITAPTSAGAATIAIGTSAGSTTTSIKAATAIATYIVSAATTIVVVPTFAATRRMTAAGSITFTIATAALTAGVIEVHLIYFQGV